MPRTRTDTKHRILTAANRLFYAEGIRAVSVDAVAEKAKITKKTLYYHFRSKDDLVTEYLKSRDQPNLDAFRTWFDAADGGLTDQVYAIFEGVARGAKHPKWRGCGFLRTAGELASTPGHPAVKAGAAHKKRFEKWLEETFAAAGAAAPATLARRVTLLLEGAFAASLIHRDATYILEAGEAARDMVALST
ncbi:helix-turn-helix domain-containing protein [Microbaculum marinum]|uniref:Helix-turn-helix domain-containing protein n=1 Tax=Microbaculum marinum TaxID=1764581 RepID=A0AAW9RC46_9HYPH